MHLCKMQKMKFRYARHSDNIDSLLVFYTKILGLKLLGRFQNHAGYNGVFLGLPGHDWHIEFTESDEKAVHRPDPDDLIVFYPGSREALEAIARRAKKLGAEFVKSKNPYWQENGIEIRDPDGFGILVAMMPGENAEED